MPSKQETIQAAGLNQKTRTAFRSSAKSGRLVEVFDVPRIIPNTNPNELDFIAFGYILSLGEHIRDENFPILIDDDEDLSWNDMYGSGGDEDCSSDEDFYTN